MRKALRVTSAEKLELLQATSIQKPSMPIAVEDTVNHGEEDGGGDSHAHLASNQVTSSPIERLCKSEVSPSFRGVDGYMWFPWFLHACYIH